MQDAVNGASYEGLAPVAAASTASSSSAALEKNAPLSVVAGKKRARETRSNVSPSAPPSTAAGGGTSTPAPHTDALAHIDLVVYANYEIRAQYPSPYPLEDLPGLANGQNGDKTVASTSAAPGGPKSSSGGGRDVAGKSAKKAAGATRERAGPQPTSQETAPTSLPLDSAPPDLAAPVPDAGPISPELAVPPPLEAQSQLLTLQAEDQGAPATNGEKQEVVTTANDMQASALHEGSAASQMMDTDAPTTSTDAAVPRTSAPSSESFAPVASTSSAPYDPAPAPPPASVPAYDPAPTVLVTANPSPSSATSSTIPTERGNRGRFLPKPAGETVKAKRAAERAARLAAAAAAGPSVPHMTQRQQRELARKAREEREREAREKKGPQSEVSLLVCDRCFKYMALPAAYLAHQKECQVMKPPGRRVYQRGATSIWEVDGASAKLYCQNLCLFAKLFIEHKYMFFDVESFTFYLLTEAMGKQEWVLGYFSKEKISYDDYNLACIVVFPPFRQRGWATLLIEFSYELSRRFSATPGTPERPLSELGQRGYLAFWISVLVRYFRAIFALRDRPPLIDTVISAPPRVSMSVSPAKGSQAEDDDQERERKKRLRRSKGWDGELPSGGKSLAHSPAKAFTLRSLDGLSTDDSSPAGPAMVTRLEGGEEVFSFATGLDELARAVNMRPDDVAYALVESGLARWRRGERDDSGRKGVKLEESDEVDVKLRDDAKDGSHSTSQGGAETDAAAKAGGDSTKATPTPNDLELELVITPELVEQVAREKDVKPMPMLDIAYVCDL